MRDYRLSVDINAPVDKAFEFTLDPRNTHLWISGVLKEESGQFPPTIGTIYKNTSDGESWNEYRTIELDENKVFTLEKSNSGYRVRYSYEALDLELTRLTYYEWVEHGELADPFKQSYLERLKKLIEQK